MILDKEGNITTVSQENSTLTVFVDTLRKAYHKIQEDHLIVNLFSFDVLTSNDLLEFKDISEIHRQSNKSFVLITDKIAYDEIPESITVVPTLQEANDIIAMEEIERDLGL